MTKSAASNPGHHMISASWSKTTPSPPHEVPAPRPSYGAAGQLIASEVDASCGVIRRKQIAVTHQPRTVLV